MATEEAMLHMKGVAINAIRQERRRYGDRAADTYIGGILLGIAHDVIEHHGRREAYNLIQGLADSIIEEDLPR